MLKTFKDRFIVDREVIVDTNNDLNLLYFSEKNGYTVFKYERNITLCDSDDLSIEVSSLFVKILPKMLAILLTYFLKPGTPFVIYAWNENDPSPGKDIEYHGEHRGSAQVELINRITAEAIEEDSLETLEFNIENVVLPPTETFYFCKSFEIPESNEKRHIVKVEQLFFALSL